MEKIVASEKAKELRRLLEVSESIVLTCHVRPDGDAIGSALGLWHLLRAMGKDPIVVLPDKGPANLGFLPGYQEMAVFTCHPDYVRTRVGQADMIVCCDFNTPSRQDLLAPVVQESKAVKVLIDHHMDPDNFAALTISHPDMSSTCELVFRLIAAMGLYEEVGVDCATCLLTGIVTDTRNFSVNVNHTDLYEILMRLLEKGIDKERIVREALNTRTFNSLKLEAFAISEKMETFPAHRAALITLSREELERFNYERGDSEGLVNRPLEVKEITYSIFLRQDPDCIKVSARSKDGFPVSEICKDLFGGGGHLQAAGGEFHGTLEECREKLIGCLGDYDRFLPRNRKRH